MSTKINTAVDENGLPVRIVLTAGQSYDLNAAPASIAVLGSRHVVADRGYNSDAFLNLIHTGGAKAHIPSPRHRLVQPTVSRRIYRQRNLVERYFNKLKHFRRVTTRFERLARDFLAAVLLDSARLWTRAYESTT